MLRGWIPLLVWPSLIVGGWASGAPNSCPEYKLLNPDQRLAIVDISSPLDVKAVTEGDPGQVRIQFSPPGLQFETAIKGPVGRFYGLMFEHGSMPEVIKRMEEMADRGYVMGDMWGDKNTATLNFRKRAEIYTSRERPVEPVWLAAQRAQLAKAFPDPGPKIAADLFRADEGRMPSGILLTGKSLGDVEPGHYQWVRLRGENFVRIGTKGHARLGGGEDALGAGEITIEKRDGQNQVTAMNNQTSTYSEKGDYLRNGVEGLWRQGIFPTRLEISVYKEELGKNVLSITLLKDPK